MKENTFEFKFTTYDTINELPAEDQVLLKEAQKASDEAYAPYSNFQVGAVAKMINGQVIKGSNQENASFPVGLCAERVLLASVASQYPNEPIKTIAISYKSKDQKSDHPITPCGICRQTLHEFESRYGQKLRLILGGLEGPVYVLESVSQLLPLAFTSQELI